MALPATLSHTVQQTQDWLKELRDNGDLVDEGEAYIVLRAVLHQLRDRLTPEEAVDLSAQLPLIVRGIYFEGWRPGRTPEKLVFALLAHHCDPGEIADVIAQLPEELKELWPQTARSFRQRSTA
jgi:uncharacterized protein (DUF2267 family)